jgi:branched-chain amino acid transport system permease protein
MDRPKIGPFDLDDPSGQPLTIACIAALIISMIVASNVARSRVGRSLLAVRENEKAAATLGVGLTQAKFVAFSISGAFAGLAGAMYVTLLELAEPTTWDLARSFTLVSMVVIGGLGSVYGATLGAFLVFGLPELFHGINDWVVLLGTGALLFVVITRLPGGLAGLVQAVRDRIVRSVASLDPEMHARLVQAAGPAGGTRG